MARLSAYIRQAARRLFSVKAKSKLRQFAFAFAVVVALSNALIVLKPALAQTRALPTAPGADRSSGGGLSAAPASLPKVAGASPLEPYLITWLLPISGIIIFGVCVWFDRRLRTSYRGSKISVRQVRYDR